MCICLSGKYIAEIEIQFTYTSNVINVCANGMNGTNVLAQWYNAKKCFSLFLCDAFCWPIFEL